MACILAVDDDEAIRNLLGRVLGKDGHDVRCAACAEEALALKLDRYDLVLLDVMMPGTDGFELCRAIRGSVDAPIVFLTARSSEDDAVYGLGLGADDYLRKPFGAAELRAKVAAHLRRERRERVHVLAFGDVRLDLAARELRLDLASREAYVGEAAVPLTKTEFDVCEFLARHPGQAFSRDQIVENVLGWDAESAASTISVHVANARAKLKAAGAEPIDTVWGVGYKWTA